MKKLLIILLLLPITVFSKTKKIDSLRVNDSVIVHVGDIVLIGHGTMPNKDFVFIYTSPISLTGKMNLPSSWTNKRFKVGQIKHIKSGLNEFNFLILTGDLLNKWWCDAEHAFKTGEVKSVERVHKVPKKKKKTA